MAILMGSDGSLDLTAGADGDAAAWKMHQWRVQTSTPMFDITGDADAVQNYAPGDPTGSGFAIVSLVSGNAATITLPKAGVQIDGVEFQTNSSKTYTTSIIVSSCDWQVEKRGGGPPQRVAVQFVLNDASASANGFFA